MYGSLDMGSMRQAFQERGPKTRERFYHAFSRARITVQDVHDVLSTVWR